MLVIYELVLYYHKENTVNNNSGGTLIPGATSSSYMPPVFNTIGSYYYYCEITFGGNGCDVVISNTAEIIVVDISTVSASIAFLTKVVTKCYNPRY